MTRSKHKVEVVQTELEIEEELELQEKGWVVQKIGWLLVLVFLILAALGMFGDGVISKSTLQSGNNTIDYERYFRYEAVMELRLDMNTDGDSAVVSFPNQYVKNFEIESIVPEPEKTIFEGDRVHYIFNGKGHMNAVFYMVPQEVGAVSGQMMVNKTGFQLSHFIFP